MGLADLLKQFTEDPTVLALSALVALDIVLGVSAAIVSKTQQFKFVIIADFLRADVLGKLVPYYAVWAALHLTGDIQVGDFAVIEETVGAAALVAVGASVLNSLRDLGLFKQASDTIAGPDPTTPG